MGVKVILFAKFTWADQSADEFEAVLRRWPSRTRTGITTPTRGTST